MPTIRAIRRRNRRNTPLEKSATPHLVEEREAPVFIPDPATLPLARDGKGRACGMRYQREKCYAWAMSCRFGEWLVLIAARERVPMDNCLGQIERLTLFVEAFLLAAATYPHLYPMQFVEDDDEPEDVAPRTVAEARGIGLSIDYREPRQRERTVPTLPGCHGTPNGQACNNLRRFGELYCPSCRRRELHRMRDAGTRYHLPT